MLAKLFKDKVLFDITNLVVNVFNETFTSSAEIMNTPITALNRPAPDVTKIQPSTAKLVKTNIEHI